MMIGVIRLVWSFFKPVISRENGRLTVIIRGAVFEGSSWAEVREQVRAETEWLRRQLGRESSTATLMMLSTNSSGKSNIGGVMMGNTRSRLEAYESFLNTQDFR